MATIRYTYTPAWDAGAHTIDGLTNDGSLTFSVGSVIGVVCGFSAKDSGVTYDEITHGFYISKNQFRIIESGKFKTSLANFTPEAVFKLERIEGVVRYYIDDALIYASSKSSSGVVYGDCSLFYYLDSIIDAAITPIDSVLNYGSAELSLGAIGVEGDWNQGLVQLPGLTSTGLEASVLILGTLWASGSEADSTFGLAELGPLSAGNAFDLNAAWLTIGPLWAGGADADATWGLAGLGPLIAEGRDEELLPEYNAGVVTLGPLYAYGYEEYPDENEGEALLGPIWSHGSEGEVNWGEAALGPVSAFGYSLKQSYLIAEWPAWTVLIERVDDVFSILDVSYGVQVSSSWRTSYASEIITSTHTALWSHEGQQTLSIPYQSTLSSVIAWQDSYRSLLDVSSVNTCSWNSLIQIASTLESSYHSLITVDNDLDLSYRSLITINNDLDLSYRSLTTVDNDLDLSYRSLSTINSVIEFIYRSLNNVYAATSFIYQSIPITTLIHTASYRSVVLDQQTCSIRYQSDPNDYSALTALYRSMSLDAQAILADVYIEPDIQIVSAQVTADESSPYYQCEVELLHSSDYQNFVRDQAFILHLFGDEYHFVVDSKGLSRTIDDQGHYQEVATMTGLSPLCLKASPRATTITQTWATPTMASAIVTELLGSVTWTLVDWMIPGYRLSVENTSPLDVATKIVEAAGGLIESTPNGEVIIRPRWPVSITELSTTTPDHLWIERMIYSAQERPTQDVLMDRIRILDSQASYQDRLEYIPNTLENGDNDPWNGMMRAYLSPWRSDLTIATTRGAKIQLGSQTEATRTIQDDEANEITAEIITFESRTGSVAYPIQTLISFEWLDENLGGLSFIPYSTTLEADGTGNYYGYSLAKISYTTRYLQVPVHCTESTETIEAQFLLLEDSING